MCGGSNNRIFTVVKTNQISTSHRLSETHVSTEAGHFTNHSSCLDTVDGPLVFKLFFFASAVILPVMTRC